MNISSIIITYKNPKGQLERLEKSLIEDGIPKKDIFFVDNEKDNLGYGGAINKVVKEILKQVQDDKNRAKNDKRSYDYFFIVNPDVVLHKNCIKELLETFKSDPKIGIVGPEIQDANGKIWSIGGELDKKRYSGGLIGYRENVSTLLRKKDTSVDFISGTAVLIKKEVFKKIGLFREDYFLYYEDVDFCMRAKEAGFDLAVNPRAIITHFASSSTGKDSPLMQYYMARNHMLFVERFAPLRVKLHELLRLPKTYYTARKYEKLGIQDYLVRRFGKNDSWS